jgi:hypothetical protein
MIVDAIPELGGSGTRVRDRKNPAHDREDRALLSRGILDRVGYENGYNPQKDPVEYLVFSGEKLASMGCSLVKESEEKAYWVYQDRPIRLSDKRWPQGEGYLRSLGCEYVEATHDANGEIAVSAHWRYQGTPIDLDEMRWKPALSAVRRSQNLRTTMGRDQWQRLTMFGNITANATAYTGVSGSATATSATTLTNSGAAFPTSGGPNASLQGQVVVCNAAGVYGVIVSNTATVLTVDQWTSLTSSSGAAGSTPGGTDTYSIIPWAGLATWIGLSTNSAAAAAGDVLRTSDGLFGDGTTSASATEPTTNGLARAFIQPTFPGAGQIQFQNTWTYSGSSLVTIQKAVLCNSKAAAGSLLVLETLLSAPAYVNASGDASLLTWLITL